MGIIKRIKDWYNRVRTKYEMVIMQYELQQSLYEDMYGDPEDTNVFEAVKNIVQGKNGNDGDNND